jgi:hypothetical protein
MAARLEVTGSTEGARGTGGAVINEFKWDRSTGDSMGIGKFPSSSLSGEVPGFEG